MLTNKFGTAIALFGIAIVALVVANMNIPGFSNVAWIFVVATAIAGLIA